MATERMGDPSLLRSRLSSGIIVLGMHRSGTSLIAEMVHRCGVFGRPEDCLPPNRWNARGYWELSPLVDFNERLLRAVGANWSFPPSRRQTAQLAELAHQPRYQEEAKALVGSMQQHGNLNWFWKDPRLSLLLPFWRHFWGKPRFIICSRDPLEICRSLNERDNLSFPVSIALWQRYLLGALEGTQGESAIVMSYSNVLQKPEQECERLASFLRKQDGPADIDIREMRKSVHKELRHCKAAGFRNHDGLSDRQRMLHQKLEFLANQPAFSRVDWRPYSLSSFWRVSLLANLLLLKCNRRWDRAFPALPVLPIEKSGGNVFAISNARGLEIWQ